MTPVLNQITQAVAEAVGAVSVFNGAYTTLRVLENEKYGTSPADGETIIYLGEDELTDEPPQGYDEIRQPFMVVSYQVPSDSSPVPPDRGKILATTDIIAFIKKDITFGGLAVKTEFTGATPFQQTKTGYTGTVVSFDVTYRHRRGAPFTS